MGKWQQIYTTTAICLKAGCRKETALDKQLDNRRYLRLRWGIDFAEEALGENHPLVEATKNCAKRSHSEMINKGEDSQLHTILTPLSSVVRAFASQAAKIKEMTIDKAIDHIKGYIASANHYTAEHISSIIEILNRLREIAGELFPSPEPELM